MNEEPPPPYSEALGVIWVIKCCLHGQFHYNHYVHLTFSLKVQFLLEKIIMWVLFTWTFPLKSLCTFDIQLKGTVFIKRKILHELRVRKNDGEDIS